MKVVAKKIKSHEPVRVVINTEFIKLESAMKLANTVPSGGIAKIEIQEGNVSVNGETCLMRGKKLYPGDCFSYDGDQYLICTDAS